MNAAQAHEAAQELRAQVLRLSNGVKHDPELLITCLDTLEDFAHEQMQEEIAGE